MQMRPYQQAAREAVHRGVGTRAETGRCWCCPPGAARPLSLPRSPKTKSAAAAVLILHTGALLQQAADKLERTSGLKCRGKGGAPVWGSGTVSRQRPGPLMRQKRLGPVSAGLFSDHYHRRGTPRHFRQLSGDTGALCRCPCVKCDGNARPGRQAESGQGKPDSLAYEYTLPQGHSRGILTPIRH